MSCRFEGSSFKLKVARRRRPVMGSHGYGHQSFNLAFCASCIFLFLDKFLLEYVIVQNQGKLIPTCQLSTLGPGSCPDTMTLVWERRGPRAEITSESARLWPSLQVMTQAWVDEFS